MEPVRTPLHLEILLHYYCKADEFPRLHAPACAEYTIDLFNSDLLTYSAADNRKWCITERGRFLIDHMLCVPNPDSCFVIPPHDNAV